MVKETTGTPTASESVLEKMEGLGVKHVLREMARHGQILELACEMPQCDCPWGRTHFEKRMQPPYDWAVSMDHYPILRSKDGKRYAENARLAHVLCNERDYSVRKQISDRIRQGMSLEQIARELNAKKAPRISIGTRWNAASVRRFFIS